jgi:hypothetical protein
MTRLLTVCAVSLAACGVGAVPPAIDRGAQAPVSGIADRVREGDWTAIEQAGKSGDATFIPLLRDVIARSGTDQRALITKRTAHFALAKLGDVQELQARWCDAVSEAPAVNDQRLLDLDVGGGFAVKALSQFLKPEYAQRYRAALRAYAGERARDVAVEPLETEIILRLQELVPHPPTRLASWDDFGRLAADVWLHWVTIHEPELRVMKPTGAGVTLSLESCAPAGKKH